MRWEVRLVRHNGEVKACDVRYDDEGKIDFIITYALPVSRLTDEAFQTSINNDIIDYELYKDRRAF